MNSPLNSMRVMSTAWPCLVAALAAFGCAGSDNGSAGGGGVAGAAGANASGGTSTGGTGGVAGSGGGGGSAGSAGSAGSGGSAGNAGSGGSAGNAGSAVSSYPISTDDALARPSSQVTVLSGAAAGPYKNGDPGDDRTFDLRSWTSTVFPDLGLYPFQVGKANPGARTVVVGGKLSGTQSDAFTWGEMKYQYDGTSLLLFAANAGDWLIVDGARYENQMDDLRPRGAARFAVRNIWSRNTRDDAIENDEVIGGQIHDSLFEGAFMFLSEQNGTWDGKYGLELSHVLVRLLPQSYATDVQSNPPPADSVIEGKGHGQLFKHFFGGDTPLDVHDCLFYVMQRSVNGDQAMNFPTDATYNNVTLLYAGGGEYPGELPATGVTELNLTTRTQTELDAIWNAAAATWKARHGVIDFENVDMDKFIHPDPF